MAEADLSETIAENAAGPKRVQGDDGRSAEQHSLADQIAADRYLKSEAASRKGLGIRLTKLIPPGTD